MFGKRLKDVRCCELNKYVHHMYGVYNVDGWFMHTLLDITGVAVAVKIFIRIYMYNSNCSIKKLVYASME